MKFDEVLESVLQKPSDDPLEVPWIALAVIAKVVNQSLIDDEEFLRRFVRLIRRQKVASRPVQSEEIERLIAHLRDLLRSP